MAIVVAARGLATLPAGYWQGEEIRFAQALLTYDGSAPLFVAAARLVNFFIRDPFRSLLALSLAATIGGAILLARAGADILGNEWNGAAAALILYLSPAMLVFTPLPNAEAFDVALVALALFAIGRKRRVLFAIACVAMAIEWLGPMSPLTSESVRALAVRFVAHPWGNKFLAFPLLMTALVGAVALRRRIELIAFAVVLTAYFIATGSMTNGVQPVLPALPVIALFGTAALARWPAIAVTAAIIYGVGSILYVRPILEARRGASPPMAAISYAAANLEPDAVLLADPQLESHASLIEEQRAVAPIKDAGSYAGRPTYLLVQGAAPKSRTFSWPESDAYGKITPAGYRVVSLRKVQHPYILRIGVYAMESTVADGPWHWLAREAVIDVPSSVDRVLIRLPAAAPISSNTIVINETATTINRGETRTIDIQPATRISIRSKTSWPADGRDLAIQLLSIERR